MGSKQYRPWAPEQMYLLPPSPREWLPENHLVYFILEVVRELDLRAIEGAIQSKDSRGERPYSPWMMTALLLYAYCVGVYSSRKIARATYEDVAFRVLCGEAHPYFTTINLFRLEHQEALAGLFVQVLRLCRRAGLVKMGHVSLDGSKVLANASKHKAMSYQRMAAEEKALRAEVERMMSEANMVDQQEDKQFGVGKTADDLPPELERRNNRLARIQQAKAALEKEAAEARADQLREQAKEQRARASDETVSDRKRAEAKTRAEHSEQRADELSKQDDSDHDEPGAGNSALPRHRVPAHSDGTPKPNAQRSFTDPDSRIMRKDGATVQAYNAQIVADSTAQVIVAEAVTNQAPDVEHLEPMLDRIQRNCGRLSDVMTMDAGYLSQYNIKLGEERNTDVYIAIGREDKAPNQPRANPTAASRARERMRAKITSESGRAIYRRRKAIVEPPFGQIKEARGFRRFSFRGLTKVRREWTFVCLTHNLLKLFRATSQAAAAT